MGRYLKMIESAEAEDSGAALSPASREALRVSKKAQPARMETQQAPCESAIGPRVMQALFRESVEPEPDGHGPPFPPCPSCGQSRYWIVGSRVICGSKHCGGARFTLTQVEFHPLQ
jgi:hypothetical protein